MKRITAFLLAAVSVLLILSGCAAKPAPEDPDSTENVPEITSDLSDGIQAKPVSTEPVKPDDSCTVAATDFAVRLFQASAKQGENTLISPVSVLYALAMTANGADGETRTQMEKVLGASVTELNSYLHSYMNSLPEGEKYRLDIANSVWFTDSKRFTVNNDFLQTNADYYGAGVYQTPFDDSTLKEINEWVEKKTDGMIRDILDKIPESAVMYLVNAVAFDAEWGKIYKQSQIADRKFTKEDGTEQDVKLMYSDERVFLEDENATGFIKYYADSKYAFAALLPDEGVTVGEYLASLTGKRLNELLSSPQDKHVSAAIPEFENESALEMSSILTDMGMPDAFDAQKADFSGLGVSSAGNLCISRILHKTFIAVNEKGTKAGAATVVEVNDEGCARIEDQKEVILDRPFVYMLIDCEANLLVFIGTVMDVA